MALVLFLAFLVVPIVELAVIIQVGQAIGVGWTVLALLGISIGGAALVKREGLRAWRRFRDTLGEARLPTREVVDGALILLAGALLLTPGFVTDAVGFLLLLPPTRALVGRAMRGRVRTSFGVTSFGPGDGRGRVRDRGGHDARTEDPGDQVVDIEVVKVERDDPGRLSP